MRTPLFLLSLWLLTLISQAQTSTQGYSAASYRPVAPTAYSILKYLDNPVDLYHGLPQITFPIYNLKLEDKSFPLALTYHAGGIRVTEEAGWTGLGWDVQVPTVIQTVNDEDDLNMNDNNRHVQARKRPDWPAQYSGTLSFPRRYNTLCSTQNGPNWSPTYSYNLPEKSYSYKSSYDYYFPVNGDFSTRQEDFLTNIIDSEPDLFKVSLFGESLTFARDFNTTNSASFRVLNASTHKVYLSPTGWTIVDGQGYNYHFEQRQAQVAAYEDRPSTVVWYLTSITSPHGRQLTCSYLPPAATRYTLDYHEKYQAFTSVSTNYTSHSDVDGGYGALPDPPFSCTACVLTSTALAYQYRIFPQGSAVSENKVYLSTASADNGKIIFYNGPREDLVNASKLDSINIVDEVEYSTIKQLKFNYDYTLAQRSPAETYPTTFNSAVHYPNGPTEGQKFQNDSLRLRLLSLYESTTGTYRFSYDTQRLPPRNSFAQDYWGYFNGAYTNYCLVPNPATIKGATFSSTQNNPLLNTQNAAVLAYGRAEVLTRIDFPTGGSKSFEYELNTFHHPGYQLADSDSSNNKVSRGNGLRIKRIISRPRIGSSALTTIYYYANGVELSPMVYFRKSPYTFVMPHVTDSDGSYSAELLAWDYAVEELNMASRYSPGQLGSGTGIGYGLVREEQFADSLGAGDSAGSTTYYYSNRPDVTYAADGGGVYSSYNVYPDLSFPTYERPNFSPNGLLDSVLVHNQQGQLVKKTATSYRIVYSPLDYGVRLVNGGSMFSVCTALGGSQYVTSAPITYLIYYPVFTKSALKISDVTTQYAPSGEAHQMHTTYERDDINRIVTQTIVGTNPAIASLQPASTVYRYKYADTRQVAAKGDGLLLQANRLEEPVAFTEGHGMVSVQTPGVSSLSYQYDKTYSSHTSGPVLTQVLETGAYPGDAHTRQRRTQLLAYDNFGRCQQVARGAEPAVSRLWHPTLPLLLAEASNAEYNSLIYSSFEPGTKAGWGTDFPTAGGVSGRWCYSLATNLDLPNLFQSGSYVLTYWVKGGSPQVSASATSMTVSVPQVTVTRADGWTQYRQLVTVTGAGVHLSFAANPALLLDEVRLCPATAQLTTFTYDAWQHVSSQTDPTGRLTTYEYDAAGRLLRTRDEQGRILAQQQYHYAQP